MSREQEQTVVFVCTGNICRSPMAEYLMRDRLGPDSGWKVASAGVFAGFGAPPSREAVLALREVGVDLTPHRSRPLTEELARQARAIVVMTRGHKDDAERMFPEARGRVHLLTSFAPGSEEPDDVPDPIGMPLSVYQATRDRIDSAIADLILHLRQP